MSCGHLFALTESTRHSSFSPAANRYWIQVGLNWIISGSILVRSISETWSWHSYNAFTRKTEPNKTNGVLLWIQFSKRSRNACYRYCCQRAGHFGHRLGDSSGLPRWCCNLYSQSRKNSKVIRKKLTPDIIRYVNTGVNLLFLLPSEKKLIELLQQKKIPVKTVQMNPAQKKFNIQPRLESLLAESPEIKHLAQKAFITYARCVFLNGNKEVFNIQALPLAEFAKSMGLPGPPKITFHKQVRTDKNLQIMESRINTLLEPKKDKVQVQEECWNCWVCLG